MAEVQAAERPLPHEEEDEAVLPDETADPLAEGKQKLTQATEEKLEGNRLFQKGENKEAIKIWRHALKLCYELSVSGTAPSQRELYDLEGALHLNLAAGLLKEKSFARSIEHCERVLQNDPTNEKAFLRMAKAHLELQEYKRAEEVTHQLLSCRPDSSAAKSLLKEIGREESVHRREEKSLYKSMFMSSSKASKQPEGHQHDAISCNKLEAMPMKGTSSQQEEKEGGKPSMTEEQRHSSSSFSSRRVIPPTKGENKICETSLGDEAVKDHTKSKSSLVKEIEKEASPSTLSSSSSLGGSLETSPAKSAPARSADSKDTKGKEEERIDMPRTSPKNEKESIPDARMIKMMRKKMKNSLGMTMRRRMTGFGQ
ncbi:tetratricopeptide repeat-containing protein [Cystoisospora suis]|uniref:Tetratricopeptide repeat-containing protein n=1 Tax=Cystoisospora suis TaxID=483139 RepID=A0A2C6KI13_9APIC|nr:tetratricopeptide repeat-containing protein [Cystoisospora suis]